MTWLEQATPARLREVVRRPREDAWEPAAPWPPDHQPSPNGPGTARDFESLALPYAAALYRTAYHLTENAVEAEDLTQETYLRAFRAFGGFRGDDPRAWLFAILRHAFLDECRRRGRRPVVEKDIGEVSAESAATAPSAEQEALRRLPSEAIDRAFAALPQDWRLIVVLADVEDLSYREIADVMGVPIGTVMSRLHRARKRMQQRLLESPQTGWKRNEKSA